MAKKCDLCSKYTNVYYCDNYLVFCKQCMLKQERIDKWLRVIEVWKINWINKC